MRLIDADEVINLFGISDRDIYAKEMIEEALCAGTLEITEQPEIKTDGDAISRRAAIDLIADYDLSMGQVVRGIYALPSAQPEIIRCEYCKFAINVGTTDMMCKNSKGWVVATDNSFGCILAERRTDE